MPVKQPTEKNVKPTNKALDPGDIKVSKNTKIVQIAEKNDLSNLDLDIRVKQLRESKENVHQIFKSQNSFQDKTKKELKDWNSPTLGSKQPQTFSVMLFY